MSANPDQVCRACGAHASAIVGVPCCHACAEEIERRGKRPIIGHEHKPNPKRTRWWHFWRSEWIAEPFVCKRPAI